MKTRLDRGRPGPARPLVPPRSSLVGLVAAPIAGTDVTGAAAGPRADGSTPYLVAFLTGGCLTCQQFWTAFADPGATGAALDGLPVVVVTPGPGTESRRGLAARVTDGMDVIMSTEAWLEYGISGAPWFVLVAEGRVTAEGPAASWPALRTLVGL